MKNTLLWLAAILITVSAAYYQRVTGPTYPKKTEVTINGEQYVFHLKRSQTNTHTCNIKLEIPEEISGILYYKRFRIDEEWASVRMIRDEHFLAGELPSQPAAGKLEYYIALSGQSGNIINVPSENPVVIRFKGNVPAAVMIPHILVIFIAMLLSNLAGLMAVFKSDRQKKFGIWAFCCLTFGGMILGPLVQKYAFGDFWTGVPFGWDLTDNKMLIAFIVWLVAILMNRKREKPGWTIAAALIVLIIFSIPHSLFGSELNYVTGAVTQG